MKSWFCMVTFVLHGLLTSPIDSDLTFDSIMYCLLFQSHRTCKLWGCNYCKLTYLYPYLPYLRYVRTSGTYRRSGTLILIDKRVDDGQAKANGNHRTLIRNVAVLPILPRVVKVDTLTQLTSPYSLFQPVHISPTSHPMASLLLSTSRRSAPRLLQQRLFTPALTPRTAIMSIATLDVCLLTNILLALWSMLIDQCRRRSYTGSQPPLLPSSKPKRKRT